MSGGGFVITPRGMLAIELLRTNRFTGLADPRLNEEVDRIATSGGGTPEEIEWVTVINLRYKEAGQTAVWVKHES